MSKIKKFPIFPVLILFAVFCFAGAGYRWYTLREEGRAKISENQAALDKAKAEMLALYNERLETLEKWEGEAATNKPALKLSETIKQSKDLKMDNQEEANRFDFVQNQISEKIGAYMTADLKSPHVKDIQKVEESINRKRKEYHGLAFTIEDMNKRYRLSEVKPVVFPAERAMKEKGLF